MKLLKKFKIFFVPVLTVAAAFIAPVSAEADGIGAAVKTGDKGIIISILVAAAAFVMTAFITMKLTKYKNKYK